MASRTTRLHSGFTQGLLRGLVESLSSRVDAARVEPEVLRTIQDIVSGGLDPIEFRPGILKSVDLNNNYERLFLILSAMYGSLLVSEKKLQDNRALVDSSVDLSQQAILKLLQDLRSFKYLKLNPTYNDVRVIQFVDARNEAVGGAKLVVDPKSRGLQLPEFNRSRIHDRAGQFKPVVTVEYLTDGVTGLSRTGNGPELIVDNDEESYWAETIYTDDPVLTTYSGQDYTGVGVSLVIDLRQSELVNVVDIKPLGIHPIRLLNIESSTDGSTWTQIPSFTEPSTNDSWWSLRFTPTVLRYMRVTLLQPNHIEQTFSVPRSVLNNQMIFDHLFGDDVRFNVGARDDSEIEARDSIGNDSILLVLDEIGRLDGLLGRVSIPGVDTAGSSTAVGVLLGALGLDNQVLGVESGASDTQELVQIRKNEYTLGLFHLEACGVSYRSTGKYSSPAFSLPGALWEVALDADVSHKSLTDAASVSFPATAAEFDIEIDVLKRAPVLPRDTTLVSEVVSVSPSTRKGQVRFLTNDAGPVVWRNGEALDLSEDFSFTPSTRTLEVFPDAFTEFSSYVIQYVPSTGQDKVDIRTAFSSFRKPTPDIFSGTDGNGLIVLRDSPFVDYEKINDRGRFFKDENFSRYHYRTGVAQKVIDEETWGVVSAPLVADISDTTTTISVLSNTLFAIVGTVRIGLEEISYDNTGSSSTTTLENCVRGINGTLAIGHVTNEQVVGIGLTVYDPVLVLVDGVQAKNLTDYTAGQHRSLPPASQDTLEYSFIQAGRNLFFNAAIAASRTIEVKYRILARYLRLNVLFRHTVPGQRMYTPDLREAVLLLNQAEV